MSCHIGTAVSTTAYFLIVYCVVADYRIDEGQAKCHSILRVVCPCRVICPLARRLTSPEEKFTTTDEKPRTDFILKFVRQRSLLLVRMKLPIFDARAPHSSDLQNLRIHHSSALLLFA
jgi:hypothetical protein